MDIARLRLNLKVWWQAVLYEYWAYSYSAFAFVVDLWPHPVLEHWLDRYEDLMWEPMEVH